MSMLGRAGEHSRSHVRPRTIGALTCVPVVEGEGEGRQFRRWRKKSIGSDHHLDVIENQPHELWRVDRMEPDGTSIEQEAGDVRQGTGPEAGCFREMYDLAQLAAQPFILERVGGNRRVPAVRPPAT